MALRLALPLRSPKGEDWLRVQASCRGFRPRRRRAGRATCVAALLFCRAVQTVRHLRIFPVFGPILRIACGSFTLLNLP